MNNVAVVVVDVQRDFLDPTCPAGVGAWEKAFCVAGVRRLLDHARSQGWQIVHVGTKHDSVATLPLHYRDGKGTPYCQAETPGCDFVVEPAGGDTVLFKTWYSAFESRLDEVLDHPDTIVWGGVATDCCVQQSAFDADRRRLRSVIPFQAVSAHTCSAYATSLTALGKLAAAIVDIDDILQGKDMMQIAIAIDDICLRTESWFNSQEERLKTLDEKDLEVVLNQLVYQPD